MRNLYSDKFQKYKDRKEMTLHKSIEAAREAMRQTAEYLHGLIRDNPQTMYARNFAIELEKALSTLPAKPMSEDEMLNLCLTAWTKQGMNRPSVGSAPWATYKSAINILRDAGVLYVEDTHEK